MKAGLEEAAYTASGEREFGEYLRTFVLHRHLELLPNDEVRTAFVGKLADASGNDNPQWTLDYCRLNIRAVKPA